MTEKTAPEQQIIDQFVNAAHGDMKTVKELLQAHPGMINARSTMDETALGAAAHTAQKNIAEFLLQNGAELDICSAVVLGRKGEIEARLDSDPENVKATGSHNLPIMFYAALSGRTDIAELLFQRGADINGGEGLNTPLHGAAMLDHHEIAEWLLSHGARAEMKDYSGKTPLDVANHFKKERTASVLQKHSATSSL